jgi:hypothetical protein
MVDEALDSLSDTHRRRILVRLYEGCEAIDLSDFVRYDDTDADRLQIKIAHVHLPKLEEYGYVQWKQDEGKITRGPDYDEIRPILRVLHENRDELPDGWL